MGRRGGSPRGRSGAGRVGGRNSGAGRVGVGGRNRGRGGHGGTNRGGFGGFGSYGRPRPYRPRPFFGGFGFPYYRRRGCGTGGCLFAPGCIVPLLIFGLIALFMSFLSPFSRPATPTQNTPAETEITNSTRERDPIEPGLVEETEYYTDELNWIENETVLIDGMEDFYNQTNVQPHLYLTDNLDGNENPTYEELEQFSHELYDELFNDEAHSLLLFFENEAYEHVVSYHISNGSQAQVVMDQEANDILMDYLDYYYHSSMSESQYFSTVYQETADRIMASQTNYTGIILVIIGLIVAVILLYQFWKNILNPPEKKAQDKNKYDAETGRRIVGEEDKEDLDY